MSDSTFFDHDQEEYLLSAYLDGELEPADLRRVEGHLAECGSCSEKMVGLRRLARVTQSLAIKEPPPEEWESFWHNLYNRSERSLGWLLLCLAVVVCGGYGLYHLALDLLQTDSLPWYIKGSIIVGCGGIMVLMISAIRERIYTRKRSRYDDVKR